MTFSKIVSKWNPALLWLMMYYRHEGRERDSDSCQDRLEQQNTVTFPTRRLLYTEKLGGLGMLSTGHVLIP